MSRWLPSPPVSAVLVATGLVAVYPVLAVSVAADVLYLVVLLLATLAAAASLPSQPAEAVLPARLGTACIGCYWAADVVWFCLSWSGRDPDGSLADVLYLAGYVALGSMLVALLMPLRGLRRVVDADMVIDIVTIAVVSVLVLWELVFRDQKGAVDLTSTGGVTALVYPVVDGVLIGIALRALGDRRVRGWSIVCLGGALLCWLAADYGYLFTAVDHFFSIGSGLLWMLGALLIAVAVTRLGSLDHHAPVRTSTAGRLLITILPLLVPPVLVLVENAVGRNPENMSLVVGTVVLVGLAFARTERLLVSERRTLRELALTRDAALEASKAKSAFLASISHEIRTPMNGVLGLSRLLSGTDLDEDQRRYVDGISRSGGSLMELLDAVLDFARHEDGEIRVDSVDLDVLEIVEDVADMLSEQAHRKGLELVATCAPDLPRGLRGDPTKLRQVLLNLAVNAVEFTEHGEVVLTARAESWTPAGPVVRFEVTDTGVGIAPGDQDRLFTPFNRVDEASHRTRRGNGLGLPIVRELVVAMGGETGVDSAVGAGSVFWCRVPLGLAHRTQPIVTRPSRAQPGTRVLVVDDNASSRTALASTLGAWELDVDQAAGSARALALLEAADVAGLPYSLAIVDLRMPGRTGLELARDLRARSISGDTPVLLLGAGATPAELRDAGIDVVLPKPVQLSRLRSAVQKALGTCGARTRHELRLEPPAVTGKGVVLVVEDSEVNRMVAVGTLRQLGYLAETADDGAQAVEMTARHNYDAILMDCRMPVMDGYDATAEIRRREDRLGNHRVPVIAMAANAVPADRERCLAAGMDDHLVKPLGRQALADTLARWVSHDESRV